MTEKLAKTISILFHPVFVPSWFTLILFSSNTYIQLLIPLQLKFVLISMIFITTAMFPLLFLLIMVRREIVSSFYLEKKEDRIYPLGITAIFYFLSYYLMRQLPLSDAFSLFLLGSTIIVIISLLITFFWKISTHLMGIGGLLGGLTGLAIHLSIDLTWMIVYGLVISGLLGFARLQLNAHKPSQVYAGFMLAFIIMLLVFLI
jgi:membrane-associated phospholipid phosphatase